jgi:putative membrane protein
LIGEDPDPRFTFANERTFLAWNRTALALIAGGLAAAQLLDTSTRLVLAVPLILFGGVLAAVSYRRWRASERALRLGEPLPGSVLPAVLTGVIAVAAVAALVLAIVHVLTR